MDFHHFSVFIVGRHLLIVTPDKTTGWKGEQDGDRATAVGREPLCWTNDVLEDLGGDIPTDTCLREAREAGYQGIELGRKFPAVQQPRARCWRRLTCARVRLVQRHAGRPQRGSGAGGGAGARPAPPAARREGDGLRRMRATAVKPRLMSLFRSRRR